MSDPGQRWRAWAFVAAQAALLVALFTWPTGPTWPVPDPVRLVGSVATVAGLVAMVVSALALRRGLTASPLPNAAARLRTTGLYALVRHPIYAALLMFAAGRVLTYGSLPRALVFLGLGALLVAKTTWEEHRLVERFPDYPAYAARVPRFIPHLPRLLHHRGSRTGGGRRA